MHMLSSKAYNELPIYTMSEPAHFLAKGCSTSPATSPAAALAIAECLFFMAALNNNKDRTTSITFTSTAIKWNLVHAQCPQCPSTILISKLQAAQQARAILLQASTLQRWVDAWTGPSTCCPARDRRAWCGAVKCHY